MKNLRLAGIGITAVAALSLAACSGSDTASPGDTAAPAPAPSSEMAPPPMSAPSGMASGVTTNADVFGPACSQLPQGNEPGSLDSMGPQPVASAASTNPLLTKLVAAVKATNLVDTLNSQEAITVFAPADPAFAELGDAKFTELAGKPDELAPILQYHVVAKRYDAKGLEAAGGSLESLNTAGGPLKIEGSGENMTVNGAKVLCGNIPTKNATVFVIDKVMMPGTNQ
ncbi:fasciclin domain-containing protein [Amycolatopsis magusensis]|uniref:Surface protein with fasciclin (FAS1) repeats n=1 Tax=Amycolatopsis magusensis TaxID=882444 RepID=A0ABS4Q233_9PSEU|nr:fasciclin domain-containing protein [Amycolatopsis magusensis]MBP2185742.1 putative surface protein with fasciclin (FAS1) repeats [Amycolatopsis magusensis]MDI5979686.1 fasciclin domain-containing protein [Amycolatopsis magusensis]